MDTANGSNAQLSKFISDFEDFLKLKREMIEHLDQSEQFYENQMGEANIVVTVSCSRYLLSLDLCSFGLDIM